MLNFLYNTFLGRALLNILCKPAISRICGKFLDSKVSLLLIPSFVKKNKIELSDYYTDGFKCFNDFFTRKIRPELRRFDENDNAFCAPCDGRLSIFEINDMTVLPVKQSHYSIADLLDNAELASEFSDGLCMVFRLGVDNYHRYSFFDSGRKGENRFIPGVLHTVRPVALRKYPVFVRNCREYTVMNTEHFGKCIQVEVGALMVGKIVNGFGNSDFTKGCEKGYFKYGGSTIIVLVKKNAVKLSDDFISIVNTGIEKPVLMGQSIGTNITH